MQRTDYRGQAVFKQLLLVILTGIAISLFLHSRVFAYEYGARIKVDWSFEAYKDANKADVIDLIQNEIIPETHGINGKGMRIKALVTFSDGVYLYDNADESFKKVKLSSTSTKKSKKAKPGKKKKSSKSSSKKTKKPKANKKKTSKSKKKKTSIKNLSTKAKGSTSGSKKNKTGKTKKKSTAGHSGKEHSSGGGKKKNKTGKTKKKSSGGHSGGGHSVGRGGKTVQYTFNLNVESYKNDNKKLPINPKMQGKKKCSYTSKRLIEALPAPTSEYYDFLGWFTKKKDGEKIEIPYTIGTKNKTLYAHWREKEYTITFSADEPGLVMPAAVKYKRTEGITLPEYSGPGYSYDGWEIRGYGEANVKELKKNDWDGDLDLRAMPREHSYKIVFEGSEGGTVNNSPIELMWSEERYPPDPICTPPADKIFDCWVWNGKEFRSWTEIKSLTPEDKATLHFVAKWKTADWRVRMKQFITLPDYKDGAYFGQDMHPKISNYTGSGGCRAYCADFVAYVYGKRNSREDPITEKYDNYWQNATRSGYINEIREGDVVCSQKGENHLFAVIGITWSKDRKEALLYTAEGGSGVSARVGNYYRIVKDDNGMYLGSDDNRYDLYEKFKEGRQIFNFTRHFGNV